MNSNDEVKLNKTGVVIGTLFVLAILFFIFCFRTVDAGEVGIIRRFGDVNRVQTSGIAIKLPWPIERMTKMEVRVQKEEQSVTAATKDMQDANAKLALNYALDNDTALRVYKDLGEDYKNRVVIPALQESFKAVSAEFTATELITDRPAVKKLAYENLKDRLEKKYGIRVVDVNIVDFSFSAEFNKAIEDKQVAAQKAEKAKQDLERIKVEAQQAIEKAEGEAKAQRLQQQTLTDKLLQKQAIEKWDGKLPSTYAGGGSSIFSIPVKK